MNNNTLYTQPEENITIVKALEFFAYKWEPFVDEDEFITDPDRITKRTDNYFSTDSDMIKATAKLAYLIRNRKIKLNPNDIIPVKQNLYTSSLITSPDNYVKINVSATKKNKDIVENGSIKRVQIKYLKIDNDTLPPYLFGKSLIRINTDKMNCYYVPICIIDYGFSKFIYPDCNEIINFSELEQYKEVKIENRGRSKIISDLDLFMCLMSVIDKVFSKTNKTKKEMRRPVVDALVKKYPGKNIADSTIKERIRPYLSFFDGKYIEVHNK